MSNRQDQDVCFSENLGDLTAPQGSKGWPFQLRQPTTKQTALLVFLPMPLWPESYFTMYFVSTFLFHLQHSYLSVHLRRHTVVKMSSCSKRALKEETTHLSPTHSYSSLLKNCSHWPGVMLSSERLYWHLVKKTAKWAHFPGIGKAFSKGASGGVSEGIWAEEPASSAQSGEQHGTAFCKLSISVWLELKILNYSTRNSKLKCQTLSFFKKM